MTVKGLIKLSTQPKKFIKDYTKKNKEQSKVLIEKVLDTKVLPSNLYYKTFLYLKKEKHNALAEKFLNKAIFLKDDSSYFYQLGLLQKRKKQWWQSKDSFYNAIQLNLNASSEYYKEYALSLFQMNHYTEASEAWSKALNPNSKNKDDWFIYAICLEKIGNVELANEIYAKAVSLSRYKTIGAYFEKKGDWLSAKKAYSSLYQKELFNANICVKLALSLEKNYQWEEAENKYLTAISLNSNQIDWYNKLGFSRERQKNYKSAAEAYTLAIDNSEENTPYKYYRLGYVLAKDKRYKEACTIFLKMKEITPVNENPIDLTNISNQIENKKKETIKLIENQLKDNTTNISNWYQLAKIYEEIKEYAKAANAYQKVIERKNSHDKDLYYECAKVLALNEQYKEASYFFREQEILQKAYGISRVFFNKNQNFNKVARYTEYFERENISKNSIMYESFGGVGMSCNPYAIFLELIEDKRFQGWKHIWVINDNNSVSKKYKKLENLILVKKESNLYLKYLTSAEYVINNSTFPSYFIRKEEQKYLNTWHGTPLKTLGMDIKDSPYQRANSSRNFIHATHMISPNPHTTNVLLNRYGINNIFDGKMAETGYPRIDLVLNTSNERKQEMSEIIGLDPTKPIVLYAPTYRGLWDTPEIETAKMLADLEKIKSNKYNLVFRGHYFAEKKIIELDLPVLLAPHNIDSCELLSIVDLLISDYSSIFYDFLPTNKPLIHYIYDYEEYRDTRGMYFKEKSLPGELCYTITEVSNTLNQLLRDEYYPSQKYLSAKENFSLYESGKSTKRVIDFLFFEKLEKKHHILTKSHKKSLLLYAPFELTGITSAIINLVNNINQKEYNISILIGRDSLVGYPERIDKLNELDENINIIIRSGQINTTLEERWIRDTFNKQMKFENEEMKNVYNKIFTREFNRLFAYSKFHTIIDFNGYRPFWTSILAHGNSDNKIIYLHSDMTKENILKFPYLQTTFNLYNNFNKLISVSESIEDINQTLLGEKYYIENKKFKFSNNPISLKKYDLLASSELNSKEYKKFMEDKRRKFINVARLSPEKGQLKLIDAFVKVVKKNKDIVLYILGDGALETALKRKISIHKMQKNIILLGHQENPYPYIKNSDCMLLTSEHEGQGLVLLEALHFNVPCIAVDIPGPRSVLENGYGILTPNNQEGIQNGIEKFLEGSFEFRLFDSKQYNEDAINMFYKKVLRD